ncbi:DUF4097 family beta strand repeat-containing protein [Streptomyces sp. Wb2n-11]|uniref:DUF4097 family beta strand repeat-containing protein n=1 Tax=Streptomyces sp. Wb2n-11 TaxID=1030533 RepID=UPI000AA4812C|nr:DUF4097 family beta strand repeat-containing protein [Streptomyces sp. Wb2n-11]
MTEPTWAVAEPRKLTFEDPVTALSVRIVNGTVNVVGVEEGPARLEVSGIEGPPLTVSHRDGTLTVAYGDLPRHDFLKRLDPENRQRSAVVSLAVPAGTSVEVGVIGAGAVVSGIRGRTTVRGISGDTTLVGLSGAVRADTVSGSLEAQGVTGSLRFHSVSGNLTVVDGSGSSVRADSVNGDMVVDVAPAGKPADITLTTVSGGVAIRLPHPADATVEANTASGSLSNAFEGLRVSGQWGAKRITGRLGTGDGRLRATTVSGAIALLRRPPAGQDPHGAETDGAPPADTPPTHTPADKKVL